MVDDSDDDSDKDAPDHNTQERNNQVLTVQKKPTDKVSYFDQLSLKEPLTLVIIEICRKAKCSAQSIEKRKRLDS